MVILMCGLVVSLLAYAATFKRWVDTAQIEEPQYPMSEVEELEYLYTLQGTRGVAQ